MDRLRFWLVISAVAALAACTPPRLDRSGDAEGSGTPEPSSAASIVPIPVSGCRAPEAALHDAARSVIGEVVIAQPGVEGDVERVEVNVCKETDSRATAVVTTYGHRDDSVRDVRHELVLDKLVARGWVVSSDVTTQRCQPNRGPQDFSPEPCV